MTNFERAFAELIGNEGGFKRDPRDRMDWSSGVIGYGQLVGTKFGLSAGTYPKLDIPNLTLDQARAIYKTEWWDKFNGDSLPYELGFQIFDSEVNHGHGMGVKFLQRALGVKDDGVIGPITLGAIEKYDQGKLIMRFLGIRMQFFTTCPTWDTNGRGWARRISHNLILASEVVTTPEEKHE